MKRLLPLFFLLFSIATQAQKLDDVFEDGGLSSIENNINFSVSDLVEGYLGIGYDRYLGEHTSIGVNAGIYLFNGPNLFLLYGDYNSTINNFEFLSGYIFHFRFRRFNYRSDGFYWQYGFTIHKHKYQLSKYSFVSFPDIKLGYNYPLTENLILSASAGIGLAFVGLSNNNSSFVDVSFDSGGFYMPFNLELYYDF